MKIEIRNFIAEIKKTTHNGFVATITQISKDFDGKQVEDFFASKFGYKTENAAKKWALKTIN